MTTIEEIVNPGAGIKYDRNIVNPKVLTSYKIPKKNRNRQKRVCHSSNYRKTTENICYRRKKPPFVVRHCENDMLARQPGFASDRSNCSFCNKKEIINDKIFPAAFTKSPVRSPIKAMNKDPYKSHNEWKEFVTKVDHNCRENKIQSKHRRLKQAWCDSNVDDELTNRHVMCNCNSEHTIKNCNVCNRYTKYFSEKSKRKSLCTVQHKNTKRDKCCQNKPKILNNTSAASFDSINDYSCSVCSADKCNNKISLAKKIHERLKETLHTAKNYPLLSRCESDDDDFSDVEEYRNDPKECLCTYYSNNCTKEKIKENADKLYQRLCRCIDYKRNIWCN